MVWAPDYITAEQLKAYVYVPNGDVVDDDELTTAVTAASRAIDDHCNRQFGQVDVSEERFYTALPDFDRGRWVVSIDDLQTTVGLTVTADGATVTDYVLEPRNAVVKGMAWTSLVLGEAVSLDDNEVSVTAPWGWTTTPGSVVQAAKLQGSRLVSRRESPFGVTGSPQMAGELRLLARVDPDVAVLLHKYVRPRKVG